MGSEDDVEFDDSGFDDSDDPESTMFGAFITGISIDKQGVPRISLEVLPEHRDKVVKLMDLPMIVREFTVGAISTHELDEILAELLKD